MSFTLQNKVRIVTAASLFDGHDAAINVMRRIMQSKGAEIIHLGHNRSVKEIVEAAIEEDAQGIAITGPRPRGDGVQHLYISDPDGYIIEIGQSRPGIAYG